VLWSKLPVKAWLKCIVVKIMSFSMAVLCHGQNHQFQHGWNVPGSKSSVSASLKGLAVKITSFSMAEM
jgi:hypothetical protein